MESREFMASSSRYVSNGGGNVGGGGGGVSASSFNEYNNGNEPYNPYTTMLTPHSPCHQSSPRHYGGPAPMGMPSINHQPMNSMDASQTTRVVDFCGLIPPESDFYLQCKNGKNNEIENVKYNPVVQSLNNLTIDDRRTTSEYPSWSTSNHYDGNEMSNMSYYQNQFPNNDQGLQRESDSSLSVPFTSRQRRWSDGNESKYTKPEVESYQQSNQQYLIKTDNSNNPYYCDCLNCKQKYAKLRPKVSFGPSMMYPMEPQCRFVKKLHDISTQCQFARKVDDCYDDSKIDYIQLTYCTLESQIVATLLFLFMLAFLFLAIGTTADDFLCPLLVSISKSLKLSDNIAGVTFLAFGNGAPDIFSSIIGIGNSDPNMVIGQLYGGGIFVTTIVVGSILIRERFQIMHRPLLRDITFYILTTSLVWVTFFLGKIELFNSLIFIGVYLIYVIVVIVSGVIYRKTRIIKDQESANGGEIFSKKGAVMPRDALKKSNKYKIQNHFNPQTISYNYNCDQEKVNRISIKSLYIPENSDTYEGVVLRRKQQN
ncbi:hypothetical protein RDWZM_008249 [Blomia tropicalis]|uniref:Sodium/calcium exchanger membrane region domain-containing protein n=1 Tax=Blomia tropicalis TaxID=40697 RepID=A0A9Q0M3A1_BLOTA|nr:hypothetical protein RDWZM_008249 [Blomia tropicalis]